MNLRSLLVSLLIPLNVTFLSVLPLITIHVDEAKAQDADLQRSDIDLNILLHIQDFGDVSFNAGEFGGNRGQSRRVEGFQIEISPPVDGLGISYMAHIQNVGDTPWFKNGRFVGSRGESKRLEGFAIKLTGAQASRYRVFYKCHIQNRGDSPVLYNGQFCGTRGQSLRLEAMQVWIKER